MTDTEKVHLLCQCIRDKADAINLGDYDQERTDIMEMADEIEELVR